MDMFVRISVYTFVYIITRLSLTAGLFTIDNECGRSKGCFSECLANGTSYEVSWSAPDDGMAQITIRVELKSTEDQYGAFGLSHSPSMGDTSVSACIMTKNGGSFTVHNSYNGDGHQNSPVKDPSKGISSVVGRYSEGILSCTFKRTVMNSDPQVFDLEGKYYVLYAKGEVSDGFLTQHQPSNRAFSSVKIDIQSHTNTCGSKAIRIQLHGSFAIIAWMVMANLGFIIARYYKPLLPSKQCFGADVWFLIHRILMVSASILTITAFIIIIYDHTGKFDVGSTSFQNAHPYIGIIIFCFVIINPAIGFLRPAKDHRFRPVFYWMHFSIGCGAMLLALINISIGLRLKEAAIPEKGFYLFIGYESFQVLVVAVLEILKVIGKRKQNDYADMMPISRQEDDSSPEDMYFNDGLPYAWMIKLLLLCLDVIVTIAMASAIISIIGSN